MKYKVGMYGGSFDPFHNGHLNCILEAACVCDELHIILSYCRTRDSVPMEQRYRWLLNSVRHLPNIYIHTIEDHASTKEEYSQDDWEAGAAEIQSVIGKPINVVFCGSDYAGSGRYEALYPKSDIVYFERTTISATSTEIRRNPLQMWDFLPLVVRPYYVKRVLIVGSESTGKSTLAQNLALRYNTNFVAEVGRETCDYAGGEVFMIAEDMQKNIILQKTEEWDKIQTSNRILFIDTDALTTRFYVDFLLPGTDDGKACNALADAVSSISNFDLVLFLDPTVAFVQDGTRNEDIAADRENCSEQLRALFDERHITYHVLSGDYAERFHKAQEIIFEAFHI